jgi:hypothetical protein
MLNSEEVYRVEMYILVLIHDCSAIKTLYIGVVLL